MRQLNRLALTAFAIAVLLQTAIAQSPGPRPGFAPGPAVVVPSSNGLPIGVPETTGGYYGEPLQRFDAQFPWLHGYFQEIPPYSGYGAFRPYNYKHVLSQAQAAGGWGESPTMPYAQQFWHRYRKRARMLPNPAVSETESSSPRYSYRSAAPRRRTARPDGSPLIVPAGGTRDDR